MIPKSNSLELGDFLLDMDFDEFIPVANFFDQYVDNLDRARTGGDGPAADPFANLADNTVSSRGAQSSESNVHLHPDAGCVGMDEYMATDGPHNGLSYNRLQQAAQQDSRTRNHQQSSGSHNYQNRAAPSRFRSPAHTHIAQLESNRPQHQQIDALSHLQKLQESSMPLPELEDLNMLMQTSPTGQQQQSLRSDSEPTDGGTHERDDRLGTVSGISKLGKSERQQMLNKAAQQRYRERKKAKAHDLEQAVKSLEDKVTELEVVRNEKQGLQDRVYSLERELAEKDGQLAHLQQDFTDTGASTCAPDGQRGSDTPQAIKQFHSFAADIRSYLVTQSLLGEDTTVKQLSREQVSTLKQMTENVYKTCFRMHRSAVDVDTWRMVEGSLDQAEAHFEGSQETWTALLDRLKLTDDQARKALILREQFLKKLEDIYIERQALNLEAIKLLLPKEAGGSSNASTRTSWFAFSGFFKRHKHVHTVANVTARLRANLIDEQKALQEVDFLVLVRLLNPLQCSYAIIQSYPLHCDVISLLNALHQKTPAN